MVQVHVEDIPASTNSMNSTSSCQERPPHWHMVGVIFSL